MKFETGCQDLGPFRPRGERRTLETSKWKATPGFLSFDTTALDKALDDLHAGAPSWVALPLKNKTLKRKPITEKQADHRKIRGRNRATLRQCTKALSGAAAAAEAAGVRGDEVSVQRQPSLGIGTGPSLS